jgi:hypothetical protein
MCERLIHCGVHHALTLEMVEDALRFANRGETLLRKRPFGGINYFIPTIYPDTDDIPKCSAIQ